MAFDAPRDTVITALARSLALSFCDTINRYRDEYADITNQEMLTAANLGMAAMLRTLTHAMALPKDLKVGALDHMLAVIRGTALDESAIKMGARH